MPSLPMRSVVGRTIVICCITWKQGCFAKSVLRGRESTNEPPSFDVVSRDPDLRGAGLECAGSLSTPKPCCASPRWQGGADRERTTSRATGSSATRDGRHVERGDDRVDGHG